MICGIVVDVIDGHRVPMVPDFVADRRFHLKLSARLQSEGNLVPNPAGDPAIFGHPRDRGKTHPGRLADHLEDGRYDADSADHFDIAGKIRIHQSVIENAVFRVTLR